MASTYLVVSSDDINRGEKGSACFCPAARALKRTIPTLADRDLKVTSSYISFDGPYGRRMELQTPYNLREFIHKFDSGEAVRAIGFYLELPAF